MEIGLRQIILNGDDFGYSASCNEGIIEAHTQGILTSTSVMVLRNEAEVARDLNQYPNLSVGLHLDLTEEGFERWTGTLLMFATKPEDIEKAFMEQVERFYKIMGRSPDHIDGHHHMHKHPRVWPFVKKYAEEIEVPVRAASVAKFQMGFYGRSLFPNGGRRKTSTDGLMSLLQKLPPGIHEIMCHPAKNPSEDRVLRATKTLYLEQRGWEYETLVDPRLREFIENDDSIVLINWKDIDPKIV